MYIKSIVYTTYMIVGIDEVGRGSLAGPVVVAACLLGDAQIDGLTDSKLLSKKKREAYSAVIKAEALSLGVGWVSAKQIDEIGISAALKSAAETALAQISGDYDQIIVDGTIKLVADERAVTMKKADQLIASVSAASVVAKVARDHYMYAVGELFPEYGFAGNVGYGAAAHLEALHRLGPTPLHRFSFAPLKSFFPRSDLGKSEVSDALAPTAIGNRAEDAACEYLLARGYTVIERNWKTKACEIDIIAEKDARVYFVEVKYRRSDRQGGGLAAITPRKVRQMTFAAELWLQKYGSRDAALSALEVTGEDVAVTNWLEQVRL